jgi:predicted flap endonuclease-1-like 5' DNA nuclease
LILFLILLVVVVVILLLWYQSRQKSASSGASGQSATHAEPLPAAPPVVEAPVVATPPPPPAQPDDLKIIEGIGPKIETILNAAGIHTFAQLAASDAAQLKKFLEDAGLRLGDPATWPEQAKLAAEGKMGELQTLQDQLKGGRKV